MATAKRPLKSRRRGKPRVFIGSTTEHLALARAIQGLLPADMQSTVWDQRVFTMGNYLVDALLAQLRASDFGVFVLANADVATVRGKRYAVPRDNVIFELGMFTGQLGRLRTFVLVPETTPPVKLPTDLGGLITGRYRARRVRGGLQAALGPLCSEVAQLIRERSYQARSGDARVISTRVFNEYGERFVELLQKAKEITLYFIHSRKWRELFGDDLRAALGRGARLTVYLPDLKERRLARTIAAHFDDEPQVPAFIKDAYRYFGQLRRDFGKQISVRAFKRYPSYSFYRFDERIILAVYPNSRLRQSVPAMEIDAASSFGVFLEADVQRLMTKGSRACGLRELANYKTD